MLHERGQWHHAGPSRWPGGHYGYIFLAAAVPTERALYDVPGASGRPRGDMSFAEHAARGGGAS
jgi:hypothetical protein